MATDKKMMPIPLNSKKPSAGAPKLLATELTIRFVDVPINVQDPPNIPAKDMGSNNLDFDILNRSES
jgi:hypothetical protein